MFTHQLLFFKDKINSSFALVGDIFLEAQGTELYKNKNYLGNIYNTSKYYGYKMIDYFNEKKKQFAAIGLTQWIIDPGFGFSKTKAENFELVKSLAQLKALDLPILLGLSRKSSIYKTLGVDAEAALNGTTVLNTIGLMGGANILRVHDVKEAKEAIILINEMNA